MADSSLGPDDVFEVRVFGEPDLTATYRVAHDGTINFPLLGSVEVGGLTPPEVTSLLERRLHDGQFLVHPSVSILVKEYNSKRVSVLGQVQRPGTFPFQQEMDIVHAITLAGGFTPLASPDQTMVSRRIRGRTQRIRVSVDQIAEGRAATFYLQPGDRVYVPESIF